MLLAMCGHFKLQYQGGKGKAGAQTLLVLSGPQPVQ